ncbi:GNAT family N-acetyltransferase [Adhaeribacter aquaticus]|uniref:GNAT family N-acetyltransferase n=1 Tax=Adhaeribacter aquaticus TaxID=299567 RepID=UPI0003F57E96|nr:GNAT family N-acetyltransferase [Adhaeribacter aquaticus]
MAEINLLLLEDIDEVMALIKEAVQEMDRQQIYQWDASYPDYLTLKTDIQTGTLYGLRIGGVLAGIIVLNQEQPEDYLAINWQHTQPLIIHRVCVHPLFQRQGVAQQLLNFAEQYATAQRHKSIRLDAFVHNPFALRLYQKLGYQERGKVTFRKGPFYCFEKALN